MLQLPGKLRVPDVIEELDKALERLKRLNVGHLIPEVQSNLAYAIPYAESVDDVASFPGRIIRMLNSVDAFASAHFGASRQIHHLVLAAMEYDPDKRAAMTIAYSETLVKKNPSSWILPWRNSIVRALQKMCRRKKAAL